MTEFEYVSVRADGGCTCRSETVACALHSDDTPSSEILVEEPLFYPHDLPAANPPKRRRFGAAIPTMYAGAQFRSRLEARWAAFFDLVSWPWEYEPIDLDDYIPDFILGFHRPLLVEVKPIIAWPETTVTDGKDAAILSQLRKVQESGWDGEAIVVGAYPITPAAGGEFLLGRFLLEDIPGALSWSGVEPFLCRICNRLSFSSNEQSFTCRVAGCYDGSHRDLDRGALQVVQLWREAGNRVQWRRHA